MVQVNFILYVGLMACEWFLQEEKPATPSKVTQIVESPLGEGCHNSYMLAYGPFE